MEEEKKDIEQEPVTTRDAELESGGTIEDQVDKIIDEHKEEREKQAEEKASEE